MTLPTDVNAFAPTSLRHLIGQTHVVKQVTVAIDAAQQDGWKFDHALLVGGPGLGKSAIAQVIAKEMATGCHEVLGQSLTSIVELNALLLSAKDRQIVFIEEAHELRKPLQTSLYLAMDKRQVFVKTGNNSTPVGIPIAPAGIGAACRNVCEGNSARHPDQHRRWLPTPGGGAAQVCLTADPASASTSGSTDARSRRAERPTHPAQDGGRLARLLRRMRQWPGPSAAFRR